MLGILLDKRVDGLIICSARLDDERLLRAIAPHRAVVLINRAAAKRHAATIEVDYCGGVEAVVTQLSALDRRRLGFAAGPAALQGGRKRREGIEAALARHGLSLFFDLPCTPDRQGGAEIAARLLPEVAQVDTMICYNDLVALGLMKPLEPVRIKVPEERWPWSVVTISRPPTWSRRR